MDIKTLESFKLSDAVKFHDRLNPRLWSDNKLRPEVKKQLEIISDDFLSELGVSDLDVSDITISGSNAAYSYTPHSDLDLHILVDMSKLPNDEVYRELFNAKKNLYNDSHDITIHNVPVELYVQDSNEPVVSLGEYSLKKDEWIKLPTKRRANFDQNSTRLKYEKLSELIQKVLKTEDLDKLKKAIDKIKQYRKAGLDKTGEFGPENLAYKILRKQGYITKLFDLKQKLHSKELSIENTQEDYHPNSKPVGPEFKPTMPKGTVRVDVSVDVNNPKEYKRYDKKQAIDWLLKTEHYGPWELSTDLKETESIVEVKNTTVLGKQLYVPRTKNLNEMTLKPKAAKWTSTAIVTDDGYTSDWVEWCKYNMPQWLSKQGLLYDAKPGYKMLVINTDQDAMKVARKYGVEVESAFDLYRSMPWDLISNDYDCIHHTPTNRGGNIYMNFWDAESTAWFNDNFLTNPQPVKINAKTTNDLQESFDQPYSLVWKKTKLNDYEAYAKLNDSSNLVIFFNKKIYPDNAYNIEFSRNDSLGVTSEGDAHRIFATVLNAIRTFIKKHNPEYLEFTTEGKLGDKDEIIPDSRIKLYDKLIKNYAESLGYNVKRREWYRVTIWEFIRKDILDEDHSDTKINFKISTGPSSFSINMSMGGKELGNYQYSEKTNRHIVEIYPEFRSKGYGKLLILKALETASKLDMNFIEDESRTKMYDDVIDSLENSGLVIRNNEYLHLTQKGLHYLNSQLYESASGYIPSYAEKDDPRFKTALTVDIKPDTLKQNAKKLGSKISRAGIPPTLRANGKY